MPDKSLITNLVALALVGLGLTLSGPLREAVLNTGLFALSGAFTNWLAVYMLFERVPGFYGSGVIPARFQEFRLGIKALVMEQFFSQENIRKVFSRGQEGEAALRPLVDKVDLDGAFDSLVEVIMNSSFGGMLNMVGGREALIPLKEPFTRKMREFLLKVGEDGEMLAQFRLASGEALLEKVEHVVDRRLEELTPQLVKEIVQQMIQRHLGWLVVWGGVLGGLIGLGATLVLGWTGA